jgi:hypothetical protein
MHFFFYLHNLLPQINTYFLYSFLNLFIVIQLQIKCLPLKAIWTCK